MSNTLANTMLGGVHSMNTWYASAIAMMQCTFGTKLPMLGGVHFMNVLAGASALCVPVIAAITISDQSTST